MSAAPELSVVIPCYDEAETVPPLMERLVPVLEPLVASWEVIFVDDGSTDGSAELLDDLVRRDPRIRVLHFSRNFGHQAALTAGMSAAAGRAVVLMDGDLQDPPELIPRFVEAWRAGHDVAYAVRRSRREVLIKRFLYAFFYRSMRAMAEIDAPLDSGDFCLLDRRVVAVLLLMPERNRFLRGLRAWAGFRQCAVPYDREARAFGTSKFTVRKLVRLALSGYVGFSVMPLRFAGVLGLLGAALGLGLAAWTVFLKLSGVPAPSGWASTFSAILFVGGVQLLVLGVIGEYLGRVYDEVRRRPMFIVREAVGFETPVAPAWPPADEPPRAGPHG